MTKSMFREDIFQLNKGDKLRRTIFLTVTVVQKEKTALLCRQGGCACLLGRAVLYAGGQFVIWRTEEQHLDLGG